MAPPLISTFAVGTRGYGQGAGGGAIMLPSGIIIPFTGASTPSDFTDFTSANDKAIVGAGVSYSSGSTGGSSTLSASVTLSNAGSHSYGNRDVCSSGSSGGAGGGATNGAHSHSATLSGTSDPQFRKYKLIKATADVSAVPAGGVILGNTTLTGDVSNIDSGNNGIMYGGSAVANGGSNTVALSGDSSSAGGHWHYTGAIATDSEGGSRVYFNNVIAGAHTHTGITSNISWNVKKYVLSAWSNAAADFEFEGSGIGMWESATPPDGWFICDGTNSTPDLRDYFIQIGSTATHGTSSGDNNHTYNGGSHNLTVNHTHKSGSFDNQAYDGGWHGNMAWNHTHNFAGGSVSQLPPYYGLYFIQKAA